MPTELWTPSSEDMFMGREAYLQYISGVMLIHDPDSRLSRGLIGNNRIDTLEGVEAIIRHSEEIMYCGLSMVITAASPPEFTSPSRAEHHYDVVMPCVRKMVAAVCQLEANRMDRINPAIVEEQPLPITDPNLYAAICHSRRPNIQTQKLLCNFMPDPKFADQLIGRKLQGTPQGRRHLSSIKTKVQSS